MCTTETGVPTHRYTCLPAATFLVAGAAAADSASPLVDTSRLNAGRALESAGRPVDWDNEEEAKRPSAESMFAKTIKFCTLAALD